MKPKKNLKTFQPLTQGILTEGRRISTFHLLVLTRQDQLLSNRKHFCFLYKTSYGGQRYRAFPFSKGSLSHLTSLASAAPFKNSRQIFLSRRHSQTHSLFLVHLSLPLSLSLSQKGNILDFANVTLQASRCLLLKTVQGQRPPPHYPIASHPPPHPKLHPAFRPPMFLDPAGSG